jgi:predicted nuclease of predicted toxin-antitoxin system
MSWKPLPKPHGAESARLKREFGKKARFLVDEQLSGLGAEVLRKLGFNAIDVSEAGLSGRADEDVFKFAWKERRILVTKDHDFLNDRRFPEHSNPGVVVLPDGPVEGEGFITALRTAVIVVGGFQRLWEGRKLVFDENREISIRSRDAESGAMTTKRYRIDRHGVEYEWV